MSPSAVSLMTIFAIIGLGVVIGFLAGVRRKMNLEQWTVGARGFGMLLMFLLMAGEIYTTFSFLGASGWAYSRGGPTLYILAYLSLGAGVSFFILPHIWELGRKYKLQTQSDFFRLRYGNKYLAAFVCVVGVIFLIPYLQLQITGLGIIVNVASFDGIGRTPAMAISVALLAAFVLASGIRAVAWISVLKDVLMLVAAFSIGIGIPYVHYGGIGLMFTALAQARPAHLTMPGATTNLGHSWYITTVLLSALGGYMWPHAFGAAFTAKSGDTLRRNAVVMPLYTITLAFILFAGFTAVMVVPGLPDGDLALLTIIRQSFPVWFLGVIGGAGALTAIVPASILILDRCDALRQESVPANLRANDDGRSGREAGSLIGCGAERHQPVPRRPQFHNACVSAPAGLRWRDPILPRRGAGPVLETRHDARCVRRHDCRSSHRSLLDPHSSGPLLGLERRVRSPLHQLFDYHNPQPDHASISAAARREPRAQLDTTSTPLLDTDGDLFCLHRYRNQPSQACPCTTRLRLDHVRSLSEGARQTCVSRRAVASNGMTQLPTETELIIRPSGRSWDRRALPDGLAARSPSKRPTVM